jgi:hypothetical protein
VLGTAFAGVVLFGAFVHLQMAVASQRLAALGQSCHLVGGHGLEAFGDTQILTQHLQGINAADCDRCGQTHGVAQGLRDRYGSLLNGFTLAAERFHPDDAHAAPQGFRQNVLLEAPIRGIERIERHLHRVEVHLVLVGEGHHPQVNLGRFVARKANKTDFALFFGLEQRFPNAVRGEVQFWIVKVDTLVNLPQVQMVRAQALERFFQLLHRYLFVTPVGTHFGHQEDFVAAALQGAAHPVFAPMIVVFPGIVAEVDPGIHGFVDDGDGFFQRTRRAEIEAAEADNTHIDARFAEWFLGDQAGSNIGHRQRRERLREGTWQIGLSHADGRRHSQTRFAVGPLNDGFSRPGVMSDAGATGAFISDAFGVIRHLVGRLGGHVRRFGVRAGRCGHNQILSKVSASAGRRRAYRCR